MISGSGWYTFLGGSGSDEARSIKQTTDGGYIAAGCSYVNIASLQGKTPLNPYSAGIDMLVVKLDASGNTVWYTFVGGSGTDEARSIHETTDGGYIIAGRSNANIAALQGKTPLNPYSANYDMLVVKLDASGNTAWYTFLGGSGADEAQSIQQTNDGGHIIAGRSNANIATLQGKTPLNPYSANYDMLVMKLDASGNTAWYTFLGGSGSDYAQSIQQTAEEGYIVAGSAGANIATLQGKTPLNSYSAGEDILVVKLDASGNTTWYSFLGGLCSFAIQQTTDGGYIVAGYSNSNMATLQGKTPRNPYSAGSDMLIVKLETTGNTAWYTFLGGSGSDNAQSIQQSADGGIIIAGEADTNIATLQGKTPLYPYSSSWDMLLVKLDSSGDTAWYTFIGGSGNEGAYSVQQTADGWFILAGYSLSTTSLFNKPPLNPNSGSYDMLMIKIFVNSTTIIW